MGVDLDGVRSIINSKVEKPGAQQKKVRLSLKEYQSRARGGAAPSATATSSMEVDKDLQDQLNRKQQEQLGFAHSLGGSYTKGDKYFYRVCIRDQSPEIVPEKRTVRFLEEMEDDSDIDVIGDINKYVAGRNTVDK